MKKLILMALISSLLLTAVGCGSQTGGTGSSGSNAGSGSSEISGNQEEDSQSPSITAIIESEKLIRFEPEYVVVDDDNVKIEITSLTMEIVNEGNENYEYREYKVNYTVTNKNKEQDLNVFIPNAGASVGAYTVEFAQNVIETKGGKINDTCYFNCVDNPNGWSSEGADHVQSVRDLLDFEAEITVGKMKDNIMQESYSVEASFAGAEVKDMIAEAEAEQAAQKEKYKDVYNALASNVWYFNGGSDTTLNSISFTDSGAVIGQVYFDGNGKHENESRDVQVSVDDSNINLIFEDESVAGIPYTLEEDSITLEGGYFTAEEIEEQIQGYWKLRTVSFGTHEFHIHFDKGSVESERASEALDGSNGEYYYYGPDEGQYTLNFGGFDTDMRHGSEWFYNIVDGEVVILHYDNICEHTDEEFPGEDGYSF